MRLIIIDVRENMKKPMFILVCVLSMALMGCETFKGAMNDIANTARNLRDIFTAGKTIKDVVD
jgi:predicted small secreted protein